MGGRQAGGGFLGIGGQGGFLGTGLLGSGPEKIKGMGFTSGVRAGEDEAIQRQRQIASGQAPSIANMALQQNLDQVGRQAMSMAASQRGASNPALAFRQAQMAQQQAALEGAQQGAILAEQERRQADEFLARQAAAQRGVALQQAQTNQAAKIQQQGQNLQFLGNVGASAAAMSDENQKENVKPTKGEASDMVSAFMDALKSYEYNYKKGSGEPSDKKMKSVMAQDLEKTEMGKQMVEDTPKGKMVDYAQGMAPLFAAIAELNERTKKLEKK